MESFSCANFVENLLVRMGVVFQYLTKTIFLSPAFPQTQVWNRMPRGARDVYPGNCAMKVQHTQKIFSLSGFTEPNSHKRAKQSHDPGFPKRVRWSKHGEVYRKYGGIFYKEEQTILLDKKSWKVNPD